ncbi:MAG: DUF3108 domain-containing protein [Lentisphaerae bacterium]|nr:DUF3108 domain-containing protein [Lentisphaerota bacterium]
MRSPDRTSRSPGGRTAGAAALCLALCLALCPALCTGAPSGASAGETGFPVGETLRYRLRWGLIPVGEGTLSTRWIERDGRRLVAIRATARTTAVVAAIYPVNDMIESIVDPETMLPLSCAQDLDQGWEREKDVVVFDHAAGKARWRCLLSGETMELDIAPDTRDALSLMYEMRRRGMAPGESASFRVLVDNKLYDLHVTAYDLEQVALPGYGTRPCLRVEPLAKFGQIFIRKGRMHFWFSSDRRRVCARIEGHIPLVSVNAVLTGVEGPGDDSWVRAPGR